MTDKVIARDFKVTVYVQPGEDPEGALKDALEDAQDALQTIYDYALEPLGGEREADLEEDTGYVMERQEAN